MTSNQQPEKCIHGRTPEYCPQCLAAPKEDGQKCDGWNCTKDHDFLHEHAAPKLKCCSKKCRGIECKCHAVPKEQKPDAFSDFFRNATPEVKAAFILDVAREASEEQRKVMGLPPLESADNAKSPDEGLSANYVYTSPTRTPSIPPESADVEGLTADEKMIDDFDTAFLANEFVNDYNGQQNPFKIADWWMKRLSQRDRQHEATNIGDLLEAFEEEFKDRGDDRYGRVKHNNTVIQRQVDWLRENLSRQHQAELSQAEARGAERILDAVERWMWENGITDKKSAQALQNKLRGLRACLEEIN